jgi:uncharacterized beta-barrel protein YwiB (DUF1934 family)
MNTTTASHAFFLLFVMAIAVVIDSTYVRRRTMMKVCLHVYDIKGSTDLVEGGYQDTNNVCEYPPAPGTEDDYNECLELAGLRDDPFSFIRRGDLDVKFQFSGDQYSTCGFNKSAFKAIDRGHHLEYQSHEFYNRDVASMTSIEYDFYCEGITDCARSMGLSIYTRVPGSSTVGSYYCKLIYRPPSTPALPNDKWHTVRIVHDTVSENTSSRNMHCPASAGLLTLKDLADAL